MEVVPKEPNWNRLQELSQETNKRLLKHVLLARKFREQDIERQQNILTGERMKTNGSADDGLNHRTLNPPDAGDTNFGKLNSVELVEETFRLMNEMVNFGASKSEKSAVTMKRRNPSPNITEASSKANSDRSYYRQSPSAFTLRSRWSTWKPQKPECLDDCKLLKNVQPLEYEPGLFKGSDEIDKQENKESPIGLLLKPTSVSRNHAAQMNSEQEINNAEALSPVRLGRQPHKAFLFASSNMPIVMAPTNYETVAPELQSIAVPEQNVFSSSEQCVVERSSLSPDVRTPPQEIAQYDCLDASTSPLQFKTDVIEADSIESSETEEMFTNNLWVTSPGRRASTAETKTCISIVSEYPLNPYLEGFKGNGTGRSQSLPPRPDSGSLRSILKGQTTPIRNSLERPTEVQPLQSGQINGSLCDPSGRNSIVSNGYFDERDNPAIGSTNTIYSGHSTSPRKSVRFADQDDQSETESEQKDFIQPIITKAVKTSGPILSVIHNGDSADNKTSSPLTFPTGANLYSRTHRLPALKIPIANDEFLPHNGEDMPMFVQIPKTNEAFAPVMLRSGNRGTKKHNRPASLQPGNGTKVGYADLLIGRPKRQSDSDDYVFVNSHSTWAPSINNKILPLQLNRASVTSTQSLQSRCLSPKAFRHSPMHQYSSPRPKFSANHDRPVSQIFTTSKLDDVARTLNAAHCVKPTIQPEISFVTKPNDAEKLANLARLTELNYETSLAKPPDRMHLVIEKDVDCKQSDYEGVNEDLIKKMTPRNRVIYAPHAIYLKGSNGFTEDALSLKPADTANGYTPTPMYTQSHNTERPACSSAPPWSGMNTLPQSNAVGTERLPGRSSPASRVLPPIHPVKSPLNTRLLQRRPQISPNYPSSTKDSKIPGRQVNSYRGPSSAENSRPVLSSNSRCRSAIPTPVSAPTIRPLCCSTLPPLHVDSNSAEDYTSDYENRPAYVTQHTSSLKKNLTPSSSEPLRRKQYIEPTQEMVSDSLSEFLRSERACNQIANGFLKIIGPPEATKCHVPIPKPRNKRRRKISSLSMEEARLIKSLDRLNSRLYDDLFLPDYY